MRTKQEIQREFNRRSSDSNAIQIAQLATEMSLEVLLDIRELLQNPPIEISGLAVDKSKE